MDYSQEQVYLRQALGQAQQRKGFCAPNPAVGAVVVKDNQILALGHHWGSGYPHAEVEALAKIGDAAIDATLYVTLEPCCHWGKTPPCTDLIIQRQLARVVFGYPDPNPQVNKKGQQQLLAAGVACEHLPLPEIDAFYQSYHFWQRHKRPWVVAKLAMSLDQKIAGPHGERIAITGAQALAYTHQGRKRADAILTTARTIIMDDPQLNVRIADEIIAKPVYILDRTLSMPLTANILSTAAKVTIFYAAEYHSDKIAALEAVGCSCIATQQQADQLNLAEIIEFIGNAGIHELWVEAGGACVSSLVTAKLAQQLVFYIAPKVIGPTAIPAFSTPISELLASPYTLQWSALGNDGLCELTQIEE